MLSFLAYEGKAAVALLVFYLFYRFLLKKETFHRFNRRVLAGTAVLSFLLPLCVITVHKPMEMAPAGYVVPAEAVEGMASAGAHMADAVGDGGMSSELWWVKVLTVLYFAGVACLLARALVSVLSVRRIIRRGECVREEDGCKIIVTRQEIDPFSWMRYVVLSQSDWEGAHGPIIAHEKAHIVNGHSAELLLVDLLSASQWFNPAVWMLRSDLRELHEYEADDAVLRSGFNLKEYQYLLIRKAVGRSGYSVANSFNHSILKNRITMMSKSRSPLSRGWRVLWLLPLVCLAVGLQAQTVYVPSDKDSEKNEIVLHVKTDGTIDTGEKTVSVSEIAACIESLPVEFPGTTVVINAAPETRMMYVDDLKLELRKIRALKVRYTTPSGSVTPVTRYMPPAKSYADGPKVVKNVAGTLPGVDREDICIVRINSLDRVFFGNGTFDDAGMVSHGKAFLREHGKNTHFSLVYDRGASYGAYLHMQSLLIRMYNEVRDEKAMDLYGKPLADLSEEELTEIYHQFPISITEAEPQG